jgi:ubiquinone/menaquinone biosynthesis C-methylase UbiE
MKIDWHLTQNDEYYSLLKNRLKEDKLIWVKQFTELINANNLKKDIKINDIGCNVGHFFRAIEDIKCNVDYCGYDISDTYINVAKEHFKNNNFYNLDISKQNPRNADITVISATLEHITDYKNAIKNIINSTNHAIILRTFTGDQYLCDECLKTGAIKPYYIQQFIENDLCSLFDNDWSYEVFEDLATKGKSKLVCNETSLLRTQKILSFKRA